MTYGDSSNQITAGLHLKHTTKLNQTQEISFKLSFNPLNDHLVGYYQKYRKYRLNSVYKAVKERIMAGQLCFLQLR